MNLSRCFAGGLGSLLLVTFFAAPAQSVRTPAGESIYLKGILPSGRPVTAKHEPDLQISGADAACSNCHRRSGLGEIEGSIKIPPISGPYLYRRRVKERADLDLPYVDGMRVDRDPYTDAALSRAIRDGIGVDGSPLNYLMPHYSLSDSDLTALIGYLKGMTPSKVPGVSGSVVNFATIVTPDADPVKRRAVLNVIDQYFTEQNAYALAETPSRRPTQRTKSNGKRRWLLHVWELTGQPAAWDAELRQYQAREPVFAVISGVGGKDWGPVHRFCEESSLPCIFPNVELPIVAEHDFYSLYFSKGVLLEAELLAHEITADKNTAAPRRVVQIFRAGDIGEAAAKALRAALSGSAIHVVERALGKGGDARQLADELQNVGQRDVLVLWLRAPDIAALANLPAPASHVLMSGLMGGLDNSPVPAAWRPVVRMTYPFDSPEKRRIRVDYALGWFALRHIPVVAEQVQVDTYITCSLVLETLTHLDGSFGPDYLVERMEGMLEHQLVSGYYPTLALAPNERFASKGGYLVHFTQPAGGQTSPDTGWIVP